MADTETRLSGTIIRGLNAATGTVALQIRHLVTYEPRLASCYIGTINVRLRVPLTVKSWDFETAPIRWHPFGPLERFSLLEVTFVYGGTVYHPAWIYHPHGSPHNADPFHVEILCTKVPLTDDKSCEIVIPLPSRVVAWTIV